MATRKLFLRMRSPRTARRNWFVLSSLASLWAAGLVWAGEAERAVVPPTSRLIVVRLSADAFAALAATEIVRHSPIDEVILGTQVVGLAYTRGRPAVQLVEDPLRAGFNMVVTGMTQSRTIGHRGPISIHSRSQTTFRATSRVAFVPEVGLQAEPATVEADTQTFTEDIQTPREGPLRRIVLRQAWSRVDASREEVTRIAQQRTAWRIAELFDEHLSERLTQINHAVGWREALALARTRGLDPSFVCSTTREYLQIAATGGQPAFIPPDLPAFAGQPTPVQVWLHESVVGPAWMPAIQHLVRSDLTVRSLLMWSRELLGDDLFTRLSRHDELSRLKIGLESCQGWMVVQIGEPLRVMAASGRAEF